MEVNNLINLLSALLGLSGTVFMANGIVGMNPRAMLRLTAPYSRMAYAPEQIDSMASQKADVIVLGSHLNYLLLTYALCQFVIPDDDSEID